MTAEACNFNIVVLAFSLKDLLYGMFKTISLRQMYEKCYKIFSGSM